MDLNPSFAQAHLALGFTLASSRRPAEAMPHTERFLALSPRDPHLWPNHHLRSLAHFWLGDLDAAEEFARRAVRQPNVTRWPFATLTAVLGAAGRDQATRDAAKALFERRPDYSCEVARDDFFFMDDPEHLELYLDGLRKAGIPEHSPKERT